MVDQPMLSRNAAHGGRFAHPEVMARVSVAIVMRSVCVIAALVVCETAGPWLRPRALALGNACCRSTPIPRTLVRRVMFRRLRYTIGVLSRMSSVV